MKIFQRLLGVIMLKPDVYREIINNSSLWKESAIFIFVAALVNAFFIDSANGFTSQSIVRFIAPFISLVLCGYLCTFFLKTMYKISTPATGMMKIFGYAQPFSLAGLLFSRWNLTNPFIHLFTSLLGVVLLSLFYFAIFIGIRAESQVLAREAIIVLVLSFLIILIIQFPVSLIINTLL